MKAQNNNLMISLAVAILILILGATEATAGWKNSGLMGWNGRELLPGTQEIVFVKGTQPTEIEGTSLNIVLNGTQEAHFTWIDSMTVSYNGGPPTSLHDSLPQIPLLLYPTTQAPDTFLFTVGGSQYTINLFTNPDDPDLEFLGERYYMVGLQDPTGDYMRLLYQDASGGTVTSNFGPWGGGVPEPATVISFLLGGAGLAAKRFIKRKKVF
jgi:hypothetical protein